MMQTTKHWPLFGILAVLLIALFGGLSLSDAQEGGPTTTPVATAPTDDATATPVPRPAPSRSFEQNGLTVEFFFETLPQGRVGLVHVTGEAIAAARIRFLDRVIEMFPARDDGYYGLLAADMEQTPRVYDLTLFVMQADEEGSETQQTLTAQVEVVPGGFISETFDVPTDRAYLIDPQVERLEFARLESVHETVTEQKMWNEFGFQVPMNAELTSRFGSVRMLNDTVQTRHTGWDLRATTGTPVRASAGGRVAFAGMLDIRGNHVVIDHGYGVYTGYSHLSQIHVTRGQEIERGWIIGMSGNSGRSSGPHLHWEVNVNGEWVDSVDFLRMWLP